MKQFQTLMARDGHTFSAYLVNPTLNTKLAGPTDGFVPASDADTILMGKVNTVYAKDPHGLKAADDGKVGFIVE